MSLPLSDLIELCRVLRHYMSSGLTLRDAIEQQSRKGRLSVRPVAQRISAELQQGADLEHALEKEKSAFPTLFISLAIVGEQAGQLPEVFAELEKYFQMQQRLRRQFWSMAAWPLLQFFAAIFVIAALLWILGMIGDMHNSKPLDPLGLGLTGGRGALIFLAIMFGGIGGLVGCYFLVTRGLKQKVFFDRTLLTIPVIAGVFRALALSRFCLALRVTTETGMSITRAMKLALSGTGNAAYEAEQAPVRASLKAGNDLTTALSNRLLFPEDFQSIISVAEESGRLHDVLAHQTEHYQDESRRKLQAVTFVLSALVWLIVAGFIILAIFRIFLIAYLKPINDLSNF